MTIEQFKNNWQPQMDSYARFSFNLDLKELVQQIRAYAIDEFVNELKKYVVNKKRQGIEPYWYVAIREVAEQLKEQNIK